MENSLPGYQKVAQKKLEKIQSTNSSKIQPNSSKSELNHATVGDINLPTTTTVGKRRETKQNEWDHIRAQQYNRYIVRTVQLVTKSFPV